MILQDWWYTTLLDLPYPFQTPLCEHIQADALVVGPGLGQMFHTWPLHSRN